MTMGTIQHLSNLVTRPEQEGDDLRLFTARAAYHFKYSWLEMTQSLVEICQQNAYQQWGFDSFFEYFERELRLKKGVVDKLTVSFHVLQQTAPQKLSALKEDETIPALAALDYYARATGEPRIDGRVPSNTPEKEMSPELSQQLYDAVFEQGCSQKQLRNRFDPVLRPKSPAKVQHEHTKKTMSTAKKIMELFEEIGGISPDTILMVEQAMIQLHKEMERNLSNLVLLVDDEQRQKNS